MTLIEQIIETDDILNRAKHPTIVISTSENLDEAGNAEVMKIRGRSSIPGQYSPLNTIDDLKDTCINIDRSSTLKGVIVKRPEVNHHLQAMDPQGQHRRKTGGIELIEMSTGEHHHVPGDMHDRHKSITLIKKHNLTFLRNRHPLAPVVKIPIAAPNSLSGLSFAFTGNAEPLDRIELAALIRSCDGVIVPLIPAVHQVSIVIVGRNPMKKTLEMIIEHGIRMIDQEILFWMIERSPFKGH